MDDNLKQENVVDVEKLRRMCFRIYAIERSNALTSEKSYSEMVDEIKSIIEKEAGKCY